MRFAAHILITAFFSVSGLAVAQSNDSIKKPQTYPRADIGSTETPRTITRVIRSRNDTLTAIAPLYAQQLQAGLGDISAIIIAENGTLYTLDEAGGRLFALPDRARDGKIDQLRVLSRGFDKPSGLAALGEYLYIADTQAIWRVNPQTRETIQLASLRNSDARPTPRPLTARGDTLWLGLTNMVDDGVKIISLDAGTGHAKLKARYPNGPVTYLADRGDGQIWAALKNGLQPITAEANTYPLEAGVSPLGFVFIGQENLPRKWPKALSGHILAVQTASAAKQPRSRTPKSGGLNIVAIGTEFSVPQSSLWVFAHGFLKSNLRHAWGTPSALAFDERGLFIADRWNGTLWRVAYDDRPAPVVRNYADTPKTELPKPKPSLKPNETETLRGSLIGSASTLTQGTTLKVGSTIIEAAEKAEIEKAESEKEIVEAETPEN